jgi:REP-associated tyrosine transposase
MGRSSDTWAEVETVLNRRDRQRSDQRKPHHLPRDYYRASAPVFCVTLCARHHGEPFSRAELAKLTVGALRFYRERRLCAVYAYCLMPDHLHAVVRMLTPTGVPPSGLWDAAGGVPPRDLRQLISQFKRYTTTQVAWKQGLHGPLWQEDFYDHMTGGEEEFLIQCGYVLDNPVRKGLVSERQEYPWSGVMDEWQ